MNSKKFHLVLAALLVAFALITFGGMGCSKLPTAPTADPGTGGDNGTNPGTPTTPAAPVLPPVVSFWRTDANGQEWTYFVTWFMKDEKVQKQEPWWMDPVPEWVLAHKGMDGVRALGHKFEYAGVIELAPGSSWDCHRVKGHFVAFQVVSDYGQYANPGLAGNWIGEGQVDQAHPTLIPGAHVAPPDYWFTPVQWGSWL